MFFNVLNDGVDQTLSDIFFTSAVSIDMWWLNYNRIFKKKTGFKRINKVYNNTKKLLK